MFLQFLSCSHDPVQCKQELFGHVLFVKVVSTVISKLNTDPVNAWRLNVIMRHVHIHSCTCICTQDKFQIKQIKIGFTTFTLYISVPCEVARSGWGLTGLWLDVGSLYFVCYVWSVVSEHPFTRIQIEGQFLPAGHQALIFYIIVYAAIIYLMLCDIPIYDVRWIWRSGHTFLPSWIWCPSALGWSQLLGV